jgi:hypothetical protein
MPKFNETFCSQCGEAFGPGDSGYSHCQDHNPPSATWYEVRYLAWHEHGGAIMRTQDYELAKQIAEPHGHVVLIVS